MPHLGSSTAITNADGSQVLLSMGYTPYGSAAYGSPGNIKCQYTGQEKDACGLMYYNARYYDPELGRFIQPDTMLDGLNRYTYCGGNPIVYADPSGHVVVEWWVYAIIYVCVAYLSGVQSSGSWNPGDWTWHDLWMAATWGTGVFGAGFSTTTGPFINLGPDFKFSPGEITRESDTEQKIAQTQVDLIKSIYEYQQWEDQNKMWRDFFSAGEGPRTGELDTSKLNIDLIINLYIGDANARYVHFNDDGSTFYCNWLAYNVAISRGVNPGKYSLFNNWNETYAGYNISKYGAIVTNNPIRKTAGWVFFYDGDPATTIAGHVEYYEYYGGNEYVVWDTSGRQNPHPKTYWVGTAPNTWGHYTNVKFVALGPAPEGIFVGNQLPYENYIYPVNHNWR